MFIAKMIEDGRKLFTKQFATIDEAMAEGKRIWQTIHFDIIEVKDWSDIGVDRVYERFATCLCLGASNHKSREGRAVNALSH